MRPLHFTTASFDDLIGQEWLMTNGSGSYASSTVIGLNTRKYHGLLVAAMSPPVRRMVVLSRVEETVGVGNRSWSLATVEYPGVVHPAGYSLLRAFSPLPYPRWAFQGEGWTIEKSVRFAASGRNELVVTYTLLGGGGEPGVNLQIKPLFALRGIHELMYQWSGRLEAEVVPGGADGLVRIPATGRTPETYFAHTGRFEASPHWYLSTIYRRERERGYAGLEDLWMPGAVEFSLSPGHPVHFVVSTEPVDVPGTVAAVDQQDAQRSRSSGGGAGDADQRVMAHLARAAETFCIGSRHDTRNASWTSIIPQYPWTPLSVRDMLISLPGILLVHGRHAAAKALLERVSDRVRDGLVPSELDEQGGEPAYYAADTSLWFVHDLWCYLCATGDDETVRRAMPVIGQIIASYRAGTSLGVGVNGDGLLRVRCPGIGPTWMNAKVGDWVITPRHGRPVEVNALWHNALMVAGALSRRFDDAPAGEMYAEQAARHREAFNARFWNSSASCCYDVVYDTGGDESVRPNQLLAVSLPFPVLHENRWAAMLETVRTRLLTPVGLRTLSPGDGNYQPRYAGDVVSRDRAYHQGTVFPWLLGPYVSAVVKAQDPMSAAVAARQALAWCIAQVSDPAEGKVYELFDGDPPHRPGGAIADARAVGEISRVWAEHVLGHSISRLPNAARKPQLA